MSVLFPFYGSLLAEWANAGRERRGGLLVAAADKYLVAEAEWRTWYPSGTGRTELVAHVDSDVAKALAQAYEGEVEQRIEGSLVVGDISEECVLAGLAVLGAFIAGSGPKATEARAHAQRMRELKDEM